MGWGNFMLNLFKCIQQLILMVVVICVLGDARSTTANYVMLGQDCPLECGWGAGSSALINHPAGLPVFGSFG